jgi:DNA-binding transcriptional LysR family regulator
VTPSRLRTFLEVIEAGSARAAAGQLSVTESAVSAALATLQREVGVALFERDGRGLRLTEAGAEFSGYARRILGLIEEGVAAARQGAAPEQGRLRIGTVSTAGEYLIPGLLASFRRHHPLVDVTLEVGARDRILSTLSEHRIDVAFAGRPTSGLALTTRATRANSLIVVAAPGTDPVPETSTWLLREPGSGTRATTLALFDRLQLHPRTLALGSPGAVIASAVLGLGITLVSADAVAQHLRAGELQPVPVPGTPLARPWHALTTAAPTATTRLFLDHIGDPARAGDLAFTRRGTGRSPRTG